jgi:hypothetical protein
MDLVFWCPSAIPAAAMHRFICVDSLLFLLQPALASGNAFLYFKRWGVICQIHVGEK